MKKFFLALVAMFAITAVASAANYTADDAAIDAAIENAVELNAFDSRLLPAGEQSVFNHADGEVLSVGRRIMQRPDSQRVEVIVPLDEIGDVLVPVFDAVSVRSAASTMSQSCSGRSSAS